MQEYLKYINEVYVSDMLRILVNSLDQETIRQKVIKEINKDDKISIILQSIFVSGEPKPNNIEGYFVYTLKTNDDKYIYHRKYYIGKFKYSLNKNKIIEYTESTKYKFDDVDSANNYATTELKSIQLESTK